MSFYTSLTGLNAATAALSVTSNNIANVGTTGFKRSRADFGDIFATSPLQKASSVIGQGVALKQVSQEFSQGNIQFSASSLDLAITGDGFFPLKSADGLQDIYTRNGTFLLDDSFAVVNSAGQFLEAAAVDSNGKADLDNLQKLIIPRSTNGDARETTLVELALNLPAEGEVIDVAFDKDDPNTYNLTTSVTVFDAGGNEYLATVYYQKTKVASPADPTNKWQTHVFIGDTKLNELLIQATDPKGNELYVNKYGEIRSENGSPPIPPQDIARGVTKLFNLDDLQNLQPSVPATASGETLSDGAVAQWKQGINIPSRLQEILDSDEAAPDDVTNKSPLTFSLNVDESREPVVIDLSYLNEPGASLTERITGVEMAREMTNAIAKAYGDERFFDFTSLKANDTSTTINLFELSVVGADASPQADDTFVISLNEQRTNPAGDPATFQDLSAVTVDDAVTAIQSEINENSYELGLSGAYSLAVSDHYSFLKSVSEAQTSSDAFTTDDSVLEVEAERLGNIDTEAEKLALDQWEPLRAERQVLTFSDPIDPIGNGEATQMTIGGVIVNLVHPDEDGDTTFSDQDVAQAVFDAFADLHVGSSPETQEVTLSDVTTASTIAFFGVSISGVVGNADVIAPDIAEALNNSSFAAQADLWSFSRPPTAIPTGATQNIVLNIGGDNVTIILEGPIDDGADVALKVYEVLSPDEDSYPFTFTYDNSDSIVIGYKSASATQVKPTLVDSENTGILLAANTLRQAGERKVIDNGDGSLTIVYAKSDGDPSDSSEWTIDGQPYQTKKAVIQAYEGADLGNIDGGSTIGNQFYLTYSSELGDVDPLSVSDASSVVSVDVATVQTFRKTVEEQQTLTFSELTSAISGTEDPPIAITVGGVTVDLDESIPAGAGSDVVIATKVAQALRESSSFAERSGRTITNNLDGKLVITFNIDEGDVDLTSTVTSGTGVRVNVATTREFVNTPGLTSRELAQAVAESVAPLQMAGKLALDEKLTKDQMLASVKTVYANLNVGNAYYYGYGTGEDSASRGSAAGALAAAEAEAAKASSTAASIYEALLSAANGVQRAAVEAFSSFTSTRDTVLEAIQTAIGAARDETFPFVESVGNLKDEEASLAEIQDHVALSTENVDSDASLKISRADSFRAIEVDYDPVLGSFTFNGKESDVIRLASASTGRNELFGLETVATAVDPATGSYGEFVLPNGREILSKADQRYGIKVTFNDTDRVFEISSGTTGDGSSVKISDASYLASKLFNFTTEPADEVVPIATGTTPVVLTSDVPVRGIQSKPAVLAGGAIGINLDNKFVVDARNDTFVVTVDNVTGLIQMPRKEDYNIEEFRDVLERRINALADSFGRTVNGVKVEIVTNPVTNTKSFQFTTGTTGDDSFLKISGPSVWGLNDLESVRGETTEWVEPVQATDAEGFPLYVDRDGNETTDAGDFSEEETRDLWAPVFFDKGELTFDTAGQLVSPLSAIKFASETIGTSGATLGIAIDYNGSTQFSNPFSVLAQDQNGRPEGDLIGLDIGDDGLVSANYSNGSVKNLAKIVLANFANPTGLRQIGDASYYATSQSGSVTLGEAGTAGFGTVRAGARERANVDLTAELIELITNQRNFQANSKAIETNNTLTQAIINIRS